MSVIANQKFNQLCLQGYQSLQNHSEDCYDGPHQAQEPEDPAPYNVPHQPEAARRSNCAPIPSPFLFPLSLRNKKWGNDKNCPLPPFCSLSLSWSHPLQNKAYCPLSPATSLCPLPVLAFSQMLPKAIPVERSCCTIFSQPASLLIYFWT
jgi:hypothetical protein